MEFMPCVVWLRKGLAKEDPDRVKLDKDELSSVIQDMKEKFGLTTTDDGSAEAMEEDVCVPSTSKTPTETNVDEDIDKEGGANKEAISELSKYDLSKYDEDHGDQGANSLASLTVFSCNEDDPLLTNNGDDSDEKSEAEAMHIKDTDNLILAGHVTDMGSNIEVYVYNAELGNLYIHHDILLSSYPMAIEIVNFDVPDATTSGPGNLVGVGNLTPVIEFWDLDMVDCPEPVFTLGEDRLLRSCPEMKKRRTTRGQRHRDAVLALAWNKRAKHVLASGSVDCTVALWDLKVGRLFRHLTDFSNKVQTLEWHPCEVHTLLSGCCDKRAGVFDCRKAESKHTAYQCDGEVERVIWNTYNSNTFLASTDKGSVHCFDVRQARCIFTVLAHHEGSAVTGLALSSGLPGCLLTAAPDKFLRVWDISDLKPHLVDQWQLELSDTCCLSACPDLPFVCALGGASPDIKVWDIRESSAVRDYYHV